MARKEKTPQQKAVGKHRRRPKVRLVQVFDNTLKILHEVERRLTEALYSPNYYDPATKEGRHDARLLRDATELTKTLKLAGDQFIKIQQQAIAEASQMTFEERLDAFCAWMLKQGAQNRQKLIPRLHRLLYDLEQASKAWKGEQYVKRAGENHWTARNGKKVGDSLKDDPE